MNKQILFEKGPFWVLQHPKGWLEVYRNGVTHSTRVATIDFRYHGDKQMRLARAEIDRRLSEQAEMPPNLRVQTTHNQPLESDK